MTATLQLLSFGYQPWSMGAILFDVIWLAICCWGLYNFLWGDGIERSLDVSENVFPSKKPREPREVRVKRARVVVWVMAVFFLFTALMRFRDYVT